MVKVKAEANKTRYVWQFEVSRAEVEALDVSEEERELLEHTLSPATSAKDILLGLVFIVGKLEGHSIRFVSLKGLDVKQARKVEDGQM